MMKTPVTPKDPKVGYYVAGVEDNGDLIIQPFPKTGCGGDTSSGGTGEFVHRTGDQMTGPLILAADPVSSLGAATKRYVDQKVSAGGGGGGSVTIPPAGDLPAVDIGPVQPGDSCPVDGGLKWDETTGQLYVCHNGTWQTAQDALTPNAPASIPIGPTPPTNPKDGDTWFSTADDMLHIYRNGVWESIYAPTKPGGIGGAVLVTAGLPSLPNKNYPVGTVAFCTADSKLYENRAEQWIDVTQTLTPNAPNAVQVVSSRPTLPNSNYLPGSVIFATDTNKLYKNDNGVWVEMTQSASIAAGSITAGMIQAGAIGTQQLAAGAITADKIATGALTAASIGAGTITSDKLAANSVTAGKIAAGAIGASEIQVGAITGDRLAMNTIQVGSAQIANASITTLKIAGEAVNVIRQVNYQATKPIAGTWVSLSITLPEAAKVHISFTGNMIVSTPATVDGGYHLHPNGSWWDHGNFWVRVDGAQQIGWFARDVMAITCERDLTAGTHTIDVVGAAPAVFNGATTSVGNLSLVVHGAMR